MHTSEKYLAEYDAKLVGKWDEVVDWKDRAKREGNFFLGLLSDANASSVLDIATGTGFHAVEFARAGYDVVAIDGAPEMVDAARKNLEINGFDDVPCFVGDWRFPETLPDRQFDVVVCLGNSLAHLSTQKDLRRSLTSFYNLVSPGGILIADQRNYNGIVAGHVSGAERNYCCTGIRSTCDLDVLSDTTVRITYAVHGQNGQSILTHAWRYQELQAAFTDVGFEIDELMGENGTDYDEKSSEFAIHIVRRAQHNA